MAVKIRLTRKGNRNHPFYRLVVMDSRQRRDGRFIEVLGYYDPLRTPAQFKVEEQRALEWLKKGAKMSDTVKSLFKRQGVLEKFTGVHYASLKNDGETLSKKARKRAAAKEKALAEKAAEPAAAQEAAPTQEPAEDTDAAQPEASPAGTENSAE